MTAVVDFLAEVGACCCCCGGGRVAVPIRCAADGLLVCKLRGVLSVDVFVEAGVLLWGDALVNEVAVADIDVGEAVVCLGG